VRHSRWRRRLLGLLLLLVASLGTAELVLRLQGSQGSPLLIEDVPGHVMRSPVWSGFPELGAPARPSRLRLVWFGASTEIGFPFTLEASPARWVERILRWRGVDVEIFCLGVSGFTADETARVMPDLLLLHPAAILLGLGHNEFERTDELLPSFWGHFELVRRLSHRFTGQTAADQPPEPGHDFDREAVARNLRDRLREMQAVTETAGVPLFVTMPVCNLADCPPMLGDEPKGASPDDAFDRGRALAAAGDWTGARAAFELARDSDHWPHRATGPLLDVIRTEAHHLVRTDLAFDAASKHGLPGDDLFVDHCHPDAAGALVLALAVADALEDSGIVPPTGHRGEAPELVTLAAQAGMTASAEARKRAETGRAFTLFALHTGHHGRMAEAAAARLDKAPPDVFLPGETQAIHALLALLRGDVGEARARLDEARRISPRILSTLAQGYAGFPWIRAAFEQNGLSLDAPGP
jgi:lysophospholipase L1-like esterase